VENQKVENNREKTTKEATIKGKLTKDLLNISKMTKKSETETGIAQNVENLTLLLERGRKIKF